MTTISITNLGLYTVITVSLVISRSKIFSYKMFFFFFPQYYNLIFKQLAAGVVIAETYWNNSCSALKVHSWARLTF